MAKRAQPRNRVGRAFAVPRDCHATHATGSRPATVAPPGAPSTAAERTVHADVHSRFPRCRLSLQRLRAAASEATRTNALLASPAGYGAAVLPCANKVQRATAVAPPLSSSAAEERSGASRDASLRADAAAKARSDCFRHRPSRGERPGSAALV